VKASCAFHLSAKIVLDRIHDLWARPPSGRFCHDRIPRRRTKTTPQFSCHNDRSRQRLDCQAAFHASEVPFWDDLVTGLPHPLIQGGFIRLPEQLGLGVTLNEEVARRYARKGEAFFSDRDAT